MAKVNGAVQASHFGLTRITYHPVELLGIANVPIPLVLSYPYKTPKYTIETIDEADQDKQPHQKDLDLEV